MPVLGKICRSAGVGHSFVAPCSWAEKRRDYITEKEKALRRSDPRKSFQGEPLHGFDVINFQLHHGTLTVQLLFDVDHPFAQIGLCFDVIGDLFNGIHHGRMIAPA